MADQHAGHHRLFQKLRRMNTPQIIVIIPVLNSYTLLSHLAQSLLSQTCRHWQAIIVDGGSDVETIRYLEQLCAEHQQFHWFQQQERFKGIFGAMNQGLKLVAANPDWSQAWVLFWGSDDWAASPDVLATVTSHLETMTRAGRHPDLLICRARYARVDANGRRILGRRSTFMKLGSYRWSVFLGPTPPHQGTLFGPKVRRRLPLYAEGFDLSADVDYFLRLSRFADADVEVLPLDLVEMSAGGVSGQRNKQRFREVKLAYERRYGSFWWISYSLRYGKRAVDAVMGMGNKKSHHQPQT
ncbi:MAG: glycosyltransferase [Cyanobacteriota bacterium]|nr:glycosyltransferase [Cyanobacteriota bacterium]